MAGKKNSPAPEISQQGIERIRDIVFGPQMRDYEQRFQQLSRDVERLQKEVDNLNEQLIDQNSDHLKKIQAVQKDTRQSDDEIRDELRQTARQLTDDKVDRKILAELFFELGNQLKTGSSLTDLLGELTQEAE